MVVCDSWGHSQKLGSLAELNKKAVLLSKSNLKFDGGTNKFNCSNDGDTITRVCRLTSDGSAPNANFECQLIGIGAGGGAIAIKKLFNRTAVDYNNNRYTWTAEDDSTESLLRLTAI